MTAEAPDAPDRPAPSPWVVRFADRVPPQGPVLDLACGSGRHAAWFLAWGHPVVALDRDTSRLADLTGQPGLEIVTADLEDGGSFPLAGRCFAAVVVTNYLHRPLLPAIVAAVAPGGVLLYETFAQGNEAFAGPSNPDYLLRPGELLEAVRGKLRVRAYEDLILQHPHPRPAAVQRICAEREA